MTEEAALDPRKLVDYITSRGLNVAKTMDLLQEDGFISDEAVWPKDVAIVDQAKAIYFLEGRRCPQQEELI